MASTGQFSAQEPQLTQASELRRPVNAQRNRIAPVLVPEQLQGTVDVTGPLLICIPSGVILEEKTHFPVHETGGVIAAILFRMR